MGGVALAVVAIALVTTIVTARSRAERTVTSARAEDDSREFSVRLFGSTGRAIPGEYAEMDIRVDGGGDGELTYYPFRAGVADIHGAFTVSPELLRQLHTLGDRLWDAPSNDQEVRPGAHTPLRIALSRAGRVRTLARPLSLPDETFARQLDSLMRAAVPPSLWQRVATESASSTR